MPEAIARHVVVAHFDDEFRFQRLPFGGALGGPTAGTSGRVSGEARRCDQLFELRSQGGFVDVGEGGGEADMMK